MQETPYSNREHDAKHQEIMRALEQVAVTVDKVVEQTTYTNGKVKKIIMAIIMLTGISIGLGLEQIGPVLQFLL